MCKTFKEIYYILYWRKFGAVYSIENIHFKVFIDIH